MEFICVGGPYGDCMSSFNVKLSKKYTVLELVNKILSDEREWGRIDIYKGRSFYGEIVCEPSCEYRYGKLINKSFPEEYLNKIVRECKAHGGYTLMNYVLYLEENI